MKHSRLNSRILFLVSVPLIAGVGFVSALLLLLSSLSAKSETLELSRLRIAQAGRLSTAVYELSKSALVQSFPMSDYLAKPISESRNAVTKEKERLLQLLSKQPAEPAQSRIRELDNKVEELISQLDALSSQKFSADAQGVFNDMSLIAAKTDRVVDVTNEIIEAERRIEASKRNSVDQMRQSLCLTLFAGLFGTIGVTIFLTRALSEGIVRRINVMKANTRLLAAREELAPVDRSPDELGELDLAFHQLADELARLESRERATIQLASDMVVGFDQNFSIQFANPSFYKTFSSSSDENLRGTEFGASGSFLKLIRPEDSQRFQNLVSEYANETRSFTIDLAMSSHTGQSLLASCSATWSKEDELFYCVLHDVTERKLLEDYRTKLLQMVGHDLRAPLTTLIFSLEKVQSGESNIGSAEAGKLLTAAHYLRNLAESLLTAEQAQRGRLELTLRPCDVSEMIDEATMILRVHAENKKIELNKQCGDLVAVSDKQKCIQVLVNLLENAIKYSDSSSRVRITASKINSRTDTLITVTPSVEKLTAQTLKLEKSVDFVRVEISSPSSSLEENDIPVLFQPFARVNQGKRKAAGYGLGLATAAHIVEAHGGAIGAEKLTDDLGALFWFTLPLCHFEDE